MNILMVTNTFWPHVGGVANSVKTFAEAYRQQGHAVTVLAPEFEGTPEEEDDVIRVRALQNFNGSDFSVSLGVNSVLKQKMKAFNPSLIHSHHPFLLGDTAMRMAAEFNCPLVFTYHTMYEYYTHYVPANSESIRRYAKRLAADYCNLCDQVIAPSESVRDILRQRGVEAPIAVSPTGIDPDRFADADGRAFRTQHGIPDRDKVAGHVGRLALEKNGVFLASALCGFVRHDPDTRRALIVGSGPDEDNMKRVVAAAGLAERVLFVGKLTGQELANAYAAMDWFAFASQTETQGMVLAEAMAAGKPVAALDAPGAREIVEDKANGRLVLHEDITAFEEALDWLATRSPDEQAALSAHAREHAQAFSVDACTERVLDLYKDVIHSFEGRDQVDYEPWDALLLRLRKEWDLWSNRFSALETVIGPDDDQ